MTQHFWKRHLACAALIVAPMLTGAGTALALPPGVGAPSAADVQRATSLFMRATDLFKARRFVPALEQFKQSYALVASPNSHLYIARCLAATGDARGAWLEFDRTADEASVDGPKYAPTRDSAVQERDELSSRLALVTVVLSPPDPSATVRVGVYQVPPDRLGRAYPVEPGTLDVVVQSPGKAPVSQPVTLRRGERREVSVNTGAVGPVVGVPGPGQGPGGGDGGQGGQPSSGVNGLRVGAFVAGGVGLVGFGLFGAFGVMSGSTYNTLNTACGGKAGCPSPTAGTDTANLISTGKTQQLIANVGLGVGIAGIAAGATLFVLSIRKRPASDVGTASADLVVGPSWLGARGSF